MNGGVIRQVTGDLRTNIDRHNLPGGDALYGKFVNGTTYFQISFNILRLSHNYTVVSVSCPPGYGCRINKHGGTVTYTFIKTQ